MADHAAGLGGRTAGRRSGREHGRGDPVAAADHPGDLKTTANRRTGGDLRHLYDMSMTSSNGIEHSKTTWEAE
ncbi:hypothetical protein [Streptomyces atacamensis]|jgi:hypothetical protein|uniref:hypothetical protein n=1 Tax=Streptomyces atacamensis TaxID=531966 RepID=UPI00399D1BBA